MRVCNVMVNNMYNFKHSTMDFTNGEAIGCNLQIQKPYDNTHLVSGVNASGKTTLLNAIEIFLNHLLYNIIPDFDKIVTDKSEVAELYVDVEIDNRTVRYELNIYPRGTISTNRDYIRSMIKGYLDIYTTKSVNDLIVYESDHFYDYLVELTSDIDNSFSIIKSKEVTGMYIFRRKGHDVILHNGHFINDDLVPSSIVDNVQLAYILTSLRLEKYDLYLLDDIFNKISSKIIEKFIELLKNSSNCKQIVMTHRELECGVCSMNIW